MINIKTSLLLFAVHILLGLLAKFMPIALTLYYFCFVAYAVVRVVHTSDRDMAVSRYVLYVSGFEIVYRISGFTLVYEFGKYACILLFILGLYFGGRKSDPKPFFLYIILLLPAIILTALSAEVTSFRNEVMFNLSGPITLALSGMYFYNRKISELDIWKICRLAVLPGISLVTVLFLGPSLQSVSLNSESNFALSGGFGPNQVSTALGFFLMLLVFSILNGKVLTVSRKVDYLLIAILIFRALLTFSRGGTFSFIFTILGAVFAMFFLSVSFRKNAMKYSSYIIGLVFASGALFYATNKLTDDWLLYRYTGVSTFEVTTGVEKINHSYLSGRERIAVQEFDLFIDNFVTGVGVGMSKISRASISGELASFASHSEFSRMLAEHGVLGLFALLLLLVRYPIRRIRKSQTDISKLFFFLFFLMGIATMLHAAMRLSLPGIIVGMSFAIIISSTSMINRQFR